MAFEGAPLGRVLSGVPHRSAMDEWVVVEPGTEGDLADRPQPEPSGELADEEQRPTTVSSASLPPALDLDALGPSAPDGTPGVSASAVRLEPEEGAIGSASSADRHPILPPPAAVVHLDGQLQPSADEGRASRRPSAGSSVSSDGAGSTAVSELAVVPRTLAEGVPMLKVSAKKVQQRTFHLDADKGTLEWESKRGGTINIESIRELRFTDSARSFMETFNLASSLSARWITIIYTCSAPTSRLSSSSPGTLSPSFLSSAGFLATTPSTPKWKALHMVALSDESFAEWARALQSVWDARRELMAGIGGLGVGNGAAGDAVEERRKAAWMRKQWREAEVKGELLKGDYQKSQEAEREGWLDFEGVLRVCRRLNVASSRKDLKARFQTADGNHNGRLDFVEFQLFVRELKKRTEIDELFARSKSADALTAQEFERFMLDVQKSPLSREDIFRTFTRYSTSSRRAFPQVSTSPVPNPPPSPGPRLMHAEGFSAFLLSADNGVSSDSAAMVTHDMTQPLSEYYISSSHNTYLVGHQLIGDSTVEGYIRALLQGCRSVELDCWDGDTEPVIYHGRTLTSKISVREVLHAIGKYAFVASPFPIILSMEVHCCVEQQDLLAQIIVDVLGSTFLSAPLAEYDAAETLPSPSQLQYKILLKAKIPVISGQQADEVLDLSSTDTDSSSASSVSSGVSGSASAKPPKGPKFKFSPALAKLLVYTIGVKYRGFNKKEVYPASNMISLSERTANKVLKQGLGDVIKHNRSHLMRLYPNVTRLTSSNYEPTRYWASGAQLVSINWQSTDSGFGLNGAMFARNGRSGYVLKPVNLRVKNKEAQHTAESRELHIRVISGQQLPVLTKADKEPSMDTFVEVTLFYPDLLPGGSVPTALAKSSVKMRTRTVDDNGFNPLWDGRFVFPFTVAADLLDLVFVRFDVRCEGRLVDAHDKSIGSYCISLGCLNQGYRHLPLLDSHLNQLLFSSIFVHTLLV